MNRCAHCFGELTEFTVFCPHCSQTNEPDLSQLINQTVGARYRLYRHLGQGGSSTVFAATDLQTDNVVVVKISDPSQLVKRELTYAIDAESAQRYWREMLERMRREAETLAVVVHPNIVRFMETGLIGNDLRFVVMEFLRGKNLRELIGENGRLQISEAIRVAVEICQALNEIHARGIVHRDINPSNVMIVESGMQSADSDTGAIRPSTSHNPRHEIKLIDFGIAKFPQPPGAPPFTQHSVLSGTVSYASPEQCQSRAVDHRSDIYSLGVVLYEMLTGERPFTGRTPTEIALKQIQSDPLPPRQINPELSSVQESVILRALAKSPDDRQQNACELIEELSRASRQIVLPLSAIPASDSVSLESAESVAVNSAEISIDRIKVIRRRRRKLALTAGAILLIAVAAGAMTGKNWLNSKWFKPLATDYAQTMGADSPGEIEGGKNGMQSDADSLEELAAQLPVGAAEAKPAVSQAMPSGQAFPVRQPESLSKSIQKPPSMTGHGEVRRATTTAIQKTDNARNASTPVVRTQPASVTPETGSSKNGVNSLPPASSKVPSIKEDGAIVQNRDSSSTGKDERDYGQATRGNSGQRPSTRDRIANNRQDDSYDIRRYPGGGNQNPVDQPDDQEDQLPDRHNESQHYGPKLIQWSGAVNREREITIELPGVPGTLEIPRIYRNRVGMVEPPSASNRWRSAKLRVFGKGGVSFVVRWWPANQVSRLAER